MSAVGVDRRLLCQCSATRPAVGPDWLECQYRATAEDMLCGTCRAGCSAVAEFAAEDITVHVGPDGFINWADLDRDGSS